MLSGYIKPNLNLNKPHFNYALNPRFCAPVPAALAALNIRMSRLLNICALCVLRGALTI